MLSPIPSRYCPEPLACDPTLELFWAAYEGNLELVVRSLRAGADVNEQLVPHTFPSEGEAYELHSGWPYSSLGEHAFGDTPLHIAARTGALAVVEELVRWRASELITNDSGETAIDIAGTQAVRNAINATRVLDEQSTARSMAWIDAARDTMVAFEQRAQERAHGLLNLQDNPFACLGKSQDNEKEIQQELPTSVAVATPEMQLCWAVYEGSLELAESAILEVYITLHHHRSRSICIILHRFASSYAILLPSPHPIPLQGWCQCQRRPFTLPVSKCWDAARPASGLAIFHARCL